VLDSWRHRLALDLTRLRKDGRAAALWALRITVAAVASYVVATLTAMLVVQVTPVSLLASGLDRVVAVVAGVSLAVAFAAVVPLQWWSLGVLILLAIMIGQVLRLRANLIEVAISGMLVLGVGSLDAGSAAWQRITETLVGAAVGIAANLLFPPKVASADAGQAIDGLADSVSDLLSRAEEELAELVAEDRDAAAAARSWLGEARRITHDIPQVGAALLHAEQGRRLNVRAVGTPNVSAGLRQGLEALEHSTVAVRSMFGAVAEAVQEASWMEDDSAPDVLLGLAQTFRELAAGVDAFGQLVRDEADMARSTTPVEVHDLRAALEGLHEARARLEDVLMAGSGPELLQLHAAVLSTVQRLLREMDLDERIRRQVRLMRPRPRLTRPGGPRRSSDSPPASEPTPEAETQVLPIIPPRRGDDPRR
jgi:hypothetical protein